MWISINAFSNLTESSNGSVVSGEDVSTAWQNVRERFFTHCLVRSNAWHVDWFEDCWNLEDGKEDVSESNYFVDSKESLKVYVFQNFENSRRRLSEEKWKPQESKDVVLKIDVETEDSIANNIANSNIWCSNDDHYCESTDASSCIYGVPVV